MRFFFTIYLFSCFGLNAADSFLTYGEIFEVFCKSQEFSVEYCMQTKEIFHKTVIQKLRKRFKWTEDVIKGKKNSERIGIPWTLPALASAVTCVVTLGDSFYTTFVTLGSATVARILQESSNIHYRRFLEKLYLTYGQYIGVKKSPMTLFESKVSDHLWQRYQFLLMVMNQKSLSFIATELVEHLFQNGLKFPPSFQADFSAYIQQKSAKYSKTPIELLLRRVAAAEKVSILGTQDEGTEWVSKAFTASIDEKQYCCTFYHKMHIGLKTLATIQRFWHPCKVDCLTVYGESFKLSDVLQYPALTHFTKDQVERYFSAPFFHKSQEDENNMDIKELRPISIIFPDRDENTLSLTYKETP